MEYYYRYDETMYSDSRVMVHLSKYPVVKHTKCGVWIEHYIGGKRFVLRGARKQFACPTESDALVSFKARKKRQIRILKSQLRRAEAALIASDDPNKMGTLNFLFNA